MSSLKINDLQAAQTEGHISELTETELGVMGGAQSIAILNDFANGNDVEVAVGSVYKPFVNLLGNVGKAIIS